MIGSGEGYIVLEEMGEFSGEGRGELWSSVQDHLGVKAELWEDMGEKELGHSCCVNVFLCRGNKLPPS